MNNYYQTELRKSFYSKQFLLATIFSFICLCIGGIEYLSGYLDSSTVGSFYLFMDSYSSGFYSVLIFLSPIICSIPFALSYLDEKESNKFEIIIKEVGLKKYIKSKLIANMLSGGMALSISLILYYLFLITIKGIIPSDINYYDLNQNLGAFIANNQFAYILVEIIFAFIFGATFANLTFCMSFIVKDKCLSIFSSMFFYMLSSVVLSRFSDYLNSQIIYSFSSSINIGILPRIVHAFILNIIYVLILASSFKFKNTKINLRLSFKIISYLSMFLLIYFKTNEFLSFYNNQVTIWEFLIYLFNDLYTVSYFASFCFLMVTTDIFNKNDLRSSLLCDLKDILIALSKFIAIFLIFSILMSIFKMDTSLEWSEFSKSSELFISIHKMHTPLFVLLISLVHMSLYLFSIALICVTVTKITKNSTVGLISTCTLIIFNICTSIGRIKGLNTFSLSRNVISIAQLNPQSGHLYFVPSLLYWICLILVICNIYSEYSNIKFNFNLRKNKKSITS
ncbi:MAG: hypothetical protein RR835_08630 [Peptostreptococcaceae bacterium]